MKVAHSPIKLFIGGLPGSITPDQLLEALGMPLGVQVKMKRRKDGTAGLGYAYLIFENLSLAHRMVNTTYDVCGRKLVLQYSKKDCSEEYQASLEAGRLFIRGIPTKCQDDELFQFFSTFVPCKTAYAIRDCNGEHKGFGFIDLWNQNDADYLVSFKQLQFQGKDLELELFRRKRKDNNQEKSEADAIFKSNQIANKAYKPKVLKNLADGNTTCAHDYLSPSFTTHRSTFTQWLSSHGAISGIAPRFKGLRFSEAQQVFKREGSSLGENRNWTKKSSRKDFPTIPNGLLPEENQNHHRDRPTNFSMRETARENTGVIVPGLEHSFENVRFNILSRRI